MRKKLILLMLTWVLLLITIGCSGTFNNDSLPQDSTEQTKNQVDDEHRVEEEPVIEVDPIQEKIEDMSLDQKIGQLVIVGLDGHTLDAYAKDMITSYHVGGFILFGRNMDQPDQILSLINDLKSANSENSIPLFFSVDEEGGKVSRMPDSFEKMPTNRVIGQKNDKSLSFKIGSTIAEEIRSFGFNMNFAPVMDIDSNPDNPVIGDRSFGASKELVADLGVQTMKGMQSEGVISVVKHFPGHGDTAVDSHIGLPVVNKEIESLMRFELVPFIEAIENGADSIMLAHILFNKIDPKNPATLSKAIINDLLRSELNFNGLVITDDMTMGAIVENYDIATAVVESIKAGSDIVLVCHGYENQIAALDALKDAIENGHLSEDRIDESIYRILKIKNQYNITDDTIDSVDIDGINNRIDTVLSLW